MSGIVGILHLNGAPIDRTLLAQLTNSLAFRGPDAQRMWCRGQIGLGHTLLQSALESKGEHQPLSVDGNAWIVADARVDGRRDLVAKLQSHGHDGLDGVPDAELILRAYQVWGEQCVDHLIGDFVFAIWNSRTRRLFCARDHFGMKPLFYARIGKCFVFSNTLNCLRRHPQISSTLNDLAIADFLVFDNQTDLDTTAFADILRLPPASTLVCSNEDVSIRRYWRLPEEKQVDYRRPQDCLEQFAQVFDAAVSDRLRGNSAAMLLSGGLDSPAVAVSARRVLNRRNSEFDFRAYTLAHDHLIPHQERHYAGLVAKALNIPVQFLQADSCRIFDVYDDQRYCTPEPVHLAMGFANADPFRETAPWSRTVLTGFGGDPVLASLLTAHFSRLYQAGQFGRMVRDTASFLMADGRLHRLYFWKRLKRLRTRSVSRGNDVDPLPAWLNPEFVRRLALRERWKAKNEPASQNHSARPEGYQAVAAPFWTNFFERFDAGIMGRTVEVCHPFLDLRVLKFLLALPVLPWCSDKEILRQAGRGVLPDEVRLRKKSPLMRDPIWALLQRPESAWVDRFQAVPHLDEYVRRDRVPLLYRLADSGDAWVHSKPLSLNFWLQRCSRAHLDVQENTAEERAVLVS